MADKRKTAFLLILFSIVFLLVYVGVFKHNSTVIFLDIQCVGEGIELSLVEQRRDFSAKKELRGEEYTVARVNMQQSYSDGKFYFFLPDYMDLSEVYIASSCGKDVVFEETPIIDDETPSFTLEENRDYNIGIGEEEISFRIMKGSELPTLWIDTGDAMDYVHADQVNTVSGDICLLDKDGKTEYSGDMEAFHGRGNSSWSTAKKSYSMKTKESVSLLGMTPGRSWVLQGGALDVTCMRNKIFMDMATECGLPNSVDCEWVDLYIDDEYYGCYLLTEKITVANGRMEIGDLEGQTEVLNQVPKEEYVPFHLPGDISVKGYLVENNPEDISGGYLLEVETYTFRYDAEPCGFVTMEGIPVLVKCPGYASYEQVTYISSYVQEFEAALYAEDGYNDAGSYYLDYIDLESFALRYLIEELSKNIDAGYSSYFFYKPNGEDIMYAGPVWDFDTACGNSPWGDPEVLEDPEGLYMNLGNWSEQLWAKADFREALGEMYAKKLLPYLDELVESGFADYEDTVYESAQMEAVLLGRENLDEEIRFLEDFIRERRDYLEEVLIGE